MINETRMTSPNYHLSGNLKPPYLGCQFLSHKGFEYSQLIHPIYICPDSYDVMHRYFVPLQYQIQKSI